MAKKSTLDKYHDAVKKLDAVEKRVSNAQAAVRQAWSDYIASVRDAVVKELKSLEWHRFTGTGGKSELEAFIEEKGCPALHKVDDLDDRRGNRRSWGGLMFPSTGPDKNDNFNVKFLSPTYPEYKKRIHVLITDLKALNIIPSVLDKSKKRKMNKMLNDAGVTPEELQEALKIAKQQKKAVRKN